MAAPIAVIDAIGAIQQANLPGTKVLSDSSVPGAGAAAITSRSWFILSKANSSSAEFADDGTGNPGQTSTLQTPTIQNIDAVGNVRVFLTVIDDQNQASETDPLLAPDSAFGVATVQYTNSSLEMLADGQRNWGVNAGRVTSHLDDLRGDFETRTVNEIADVALVTSTGPHLDNLMNNVYATQNGTAGGVSLHKHPVETLDPATTTENGSVTLDEAPLNPVNPKVLNNEFTVYSANIEGTNTLNGYIPGKLMLQPQTTVNENTAHVGFISNEISGTINEFSVSLRNGGDSSLGGQLKFGLYVMTQGQWQVNDYAGAVLVSSLSASAPANPGAATYQQATNLNTVIGQRKVLAVYVQQDWAGGVHAASSFGTVTIICKRNV